MAIRVKLRDHELLFAASIGCNRNISSLAQGLQNAHGLSPDKNWQVNIEGACGEMVVAKYLNLYYSGSVDTFKYGGDVGDLQVRTRSKPEYELIVRRNDRDDDLFILVTGNAPEYRIVGWIKGNDAKKKKWLQGYGGREAAFFVPHDALLPMKLLKERISP